MMDVPIVVGVNRTQDGSIAVALGRSAVFSLQKERISRRKHHWGRLGDVPVPVRYFPEASSINFQRSLQYGFGTLGLVGQYWLDRLGVWRSKLFTENARDGSAARG